MSGFGEYGRKHGETATDTDATIATVDPHAEEDIALLLYHGTEARLSLTTLDYQGNTPAQAAHQAGASTLAQLLEPDESPDKGCGALEEPSLDSRREARLWSFLVHSPMRTPPPLRPPPWWVAHASLPHALFAVAPATPTVAVAFGTSVMVALALGTIVLLVALYSTRVYSGVRVYTINAAVLFGMVASASYIFGSTILLYSLDAVTELHSRVLTCATLLFLLGYWALYFRLQSLDPGHIPGGNPEERAKYFEALENL